MKRTITLIGIFVFLSITGCMKPKYVATLGADVYHVPDCQYVQNSLEEYGPIKKLVEVIKVTTDVDELDHETEDALKALAQLKCFDVKVSVELTPQVVMRGIFTITKTTYI